MSIGDLYEVLEHNYAKIIVRARRNVILHMKLVKKEWIKQRMVQSKLSGETIGSGRPVRGLSEPTPC